MLPLGTRTGGVPGFERKRRAVVQPGSRARCRRWLTPSYRFGIGGLPSSLAEPRREVVRYEQLGFDFVAKGDHAGGLSPFSLLTAAAAVSERLRLRTYVLNASFWNPVLLAHAAPTLDRLSDGRLELGLGAGTVTSEFDAAGIAWRPATARIEQMKPTLLSVREQLADPNHPPRPVQDSIPMLVGAMSRGGPAVAAEHRGCHRVPRIASPGRASTRDTDRRDGRADR